MPQVFEVPTIYHLRFLRTKCACGYMPMLSKQSKTATKETEVILLRYQFYDDKKLYSNTERH